MPLTQVPDELLGGKSAAKAWVVFDATRNSSGGSDVLNTARFIIASYNVSSVVKTSTGNHTVNFTNALADANYCAIGMGRGNALVSLDATTPTTTQCFITTRVNSTGAGNDSPYNALVVFD